MISALYVDDEINLLDITKEFLEKGREFRIDTAQSVDEALAMMKEKDYDVVISDYLMPEKDGIEFLSEIRGTGNNIPFIIFTGRGCEDVVIQAINNGADFYIQKGDDPRAQFDELIRKLKAAADRKHKTDEIVRKNEELLDINRKLEHDEKELRNRLEKVKRNKAELAESRSRLQQVITFLPDPTFAIDMEGRVIAWNSAMEKLSGVKAGDIVGKGDYEYSFRLLGRRYPALIDLVVNPGLKKKYNFLPAFSCEKSMISEGFFPEFGTEKDVTKWFTASPLYDTDGSPAGAIESVRDVTHLKNALKILENQSDDRNKTSTKVSGASSVNRIEEERSIMKENLENFFNEIEDYLYVTDDSGTILMTNSSLQKYTGYREEELYGKHISFIHPPEFRDEIGIVLNGITEGNLGSHFIPVRTKEGDVIPAETRVTRGTLGEKEVILGVSRNVSELQKAHDRLLESDRRMRAIFDQSFQLAGILDKKGRVLFVNRTAMNFIEGGYEECRGQYFWNTRWWVDKPGMRDKIRDAVNVAAGGVPVKSEISIPDRDGILRSLDFSIRPVRDENGEIIYLIPEAVDITRRKKAEEALLQANHKLLLLNSITRHDILNRVTPVLGFLEIVKDQSENPDTSEMMEKMKSQVTDIENLIKFTGLYDELGAVEPSWQDPAKIMNSLHVPDEITFRIDLPEIEIYADPMLEKVFSNLLDNSLMHGKGITEISVSCRKTGEGTSIFWRDNGRGIPECSKEKIFLRGFGENSGLGLFLSREILSITNIEIRESGKEGEGAVFEITVPPDGCRQRNSMKDGNIEYL